MRLLTAVCIAAVAVAFCVPAFAETQNVKISGDIRVSHVFQGDIDGTDSGSGSNENDSETFFMQQVGLNIEADLTDNASTFVRIINERTWDAEDASWQDGTAGEAGPGADQFGIDLDEAYVVLKEMLYAPLTLKVGRQDIFLGRGLLIADSGVYDRADNLPLAIGERSDMNAFDAIRATLDYDPWTLDLIYAKIRERTENITDDTDLYVVNAGYDFTDRDAEAEAYFIMRHNKSGRVNTGTMFDPNIINTVGLRGSLVPMDDVPLNIFAEGAFQWGKRRTSAGLNAEREAWAFNLGGAYSFADVRMAPVLTAEYVFASGEEAASGGDWQAFNSLYTCGVCPLAIAGARNVTKFMDDDVVQLVSANQNNNGTTNEHLFLAKLTLDPMEDVNVEAKWGYLTFDEEPVAGRDKDIGHEIDATVTYDYTEDVTFAVETAFFFPGDYYPETSDDNASQVISSVKVEF